jgi:hypothetical protein
VLCEFFPIKMRRTMLAVESKAGKVPQTRFQTGSLRNDGLTSDGQAALFLEIHNSTDTKTLYEKSRVGDRVELSMQAEGGKRFKPRYCSLLARSLLKFGALRVVRPRVGHAKRGFRSCSGSNSRSPAGGVLRDCGKRGSAARRVGTQVRNPSERRTSCPLGRGSVLWGVELELELTRSG